MRIYILGASGMLGHAMTQHFKRAHSVHADVSTTRPDVMNYDALRASIRAFQPDIVINLSAICDMEKCENDPSSALGIHVLGSANAALISDEIKATYVYVSSACVFDGTETTYTTSSLTKPISVYGKTKLMAEQVARSVKQHVVLRTEWCFGGGPQHDRKFLGKLYHQIENGASVVYAVDDKFGTLSYLPDLCVALEKILEQGLLGTFHVCCEGAASRYEVAREFVRLLNRGVRVTPVSSSYFIKEYGAPRPTSEILINSKIEGFSPRPWRVALLEYAKEFKA